MEGRTPENSAEQTDMGWDIRPQAFASLLSRLHAGYDFPRYVITENGPAMADDQRLPDGSVDDLPRVRYLHDHLAVLADALASSMPVEGYFAWSLMDNFEWAHGYAKRFGIVEIDPETLARRPKRSARWFSRVAATGTLPDPVSNVS